jgi:hypothetical protein
MFFAGATRAKGTDAVFREADLDGDGQITLDELMVAATNALAGSGSHLSRTRVETLMRAWDTDGDGSISIQEFKRMIKKMRATDNPELHEAWRLIGSLQQQIEKLKVQSGYKAEEAKDAAAIQRATTLLHEGNEQDKARAAFEIGVKPARRQSLAQRESIASVSRHQAIVPLVALVSAGTPGQREQAAGALWNLAANGDKGEIAAAGAIPALVACVEGGQACTPTLQHFAAAGLSSLAAGNADNRVAIAKAHAIPPLVALVGTGTLEQRQAATRALNNLSVGNGDNRAAIAKMGGVSLLVKQLSASDSTPALKEETAAALASLCAGNEANKTAVAAAGAIPILVDLVKGGETAPVKARAVAALRVLASKAEYRMAIAQAGLIPLLIEFLRSGTASQRHAAAGALWNLAFDNVSNATAIAKGGGIPPLVELTRTSPTQAQWEEAVGALESLNCSPANARLLKAHGWPPP